MIFQPYVMSRPVECEACAGTGRYGFRDDDECPVCHGGGSIEVPMTKPHEETWTVGEDGAVWASYLDTAQAFGVVQKRLVPWGVDGAAVAKLAAQSPAMVRLLLKVQWGGYVKECPSCHEPEVHGHATDCELAAVLRAAGVLL